jgi:predicted nucleotidyltransferase
MPPQSEDFVKVLNQAGVEYVVIGGVAMVAHGSAYVTFDFDACYRRSQENIEKLCRALQPFRVRLRGAPEDLPFRFEAKTIQNGLNFTFTTDIGDIDLLGEVAGLGSYEAVFAASEVKQVATYQCQMLSLDGLIKAKRAAGREKDLKALKELQALKDLKERLGEP